MRLPSSLLLLPTFSPLPSESEGSDSFGNARPHRFTTHSPALLPLSAGAAHFVCDGFSFPVLLLQKKYTYGISLAFPFLCLHFSLRCFACFLSSLPPSPPLSRNPEGMRGSVHSRSRPRGHLHAAFFFCLPSQRVRLYEARGETEVASHRTHRVFSRVRALPPDSLFRCLFLCASIRGKRPVTSWSQGPSLTHPPTHGSSASPASLLQEGNRNDNNNKAFGSPHSHD